MNLKRRQKWEDSDIEVRLALIRNKVGQIYPTDLHVRVKNIHPPAKCSQLAVSIFLSQVYKPSSFKILKSAGKFGMEPAIH